MTVLPFGQVAPPFRRAMACVVDAAIANILVIICVSALALTSLSLQSSEMLLVAIPVGVSLIVLVQLAWMAVYTKMQTGRGSIGMRIAGVRLVSEEGTPLGFWRAVLRNVVFGLAGMIIVGYFSPLFDSSGRYQGWHDKVARSLVTDTRVAQRGAPMMTAGSSALAARVPGAPPVPPLPHGLEGAPVPPAPPVPPIPSALPAPASPDGVAIPPAYPAPPAHAAPAAAAPAAAAPAPASATPQGTTPDQASPFRAPEPVAADGLIAFVPGITVDGPPPRSAAPASAAPAAPAARPAADELAPAVDEALPAAPAFTPHDPAAPVPPARSAEAPTVPPAAPAFPAAPAAAAAPAAPVPDSAPAASDDAGLDDDLEQTRISIPGHRLIFTWDDGTRVTVSGRTLFGRNPAPEAGAEVVIVRDETLSLSKTHFEAAASTSGGWVIDRHSTNGMTLVRDGQRIACPAGQRVPVRLGDALEIGDRIVTIGGYA